MTGAILEEDGLVRVKAEKKQLAKKVKLSSRRACGEGLVEKELRCRGGVHAPHRLRTSWLSYLRNESDVKYFLSDK